MKTLIDTCVISELRKEKPHARVLEAYSQLDSEEIWLSIMSIGEIAKGIALLDQSKRKKELEIWFNSLQKEYKDKILGVDLSIMLIWGDLTAQAQKRGHIVSACDGLIAATAKNHGLTLMTRNIADFESLGISLLNPWD
jgi:toxin FitB